MTDNPFSDDAPLHDPGIRENADSTHAHDAGRSDFAEASAPPFPWPPHEGGSIVEAWGRTWKGAALEPSRFFASMPRDGSLGAAILYYLSIGVFVAGAQLFWRMIGVGGAPSDTAEAEVLAAWSPLVDFLVSPLVLLLTLFIAAGVTHVLLLLLGAAGGKYSLTTRVFAFAYSPQLLGIVPVLGPFVGFAWMVVVAVVGVREAHRTTTWKAAAAVLIPVGIGLAFAALAAFIAATGNLLDLPV